MTPPIAPTVVIGIGAPMRRDDALGVDVAEALSSPGGIVGDAVDVVSMSGEPSQLVAAWQGRSLAVVVDAVRAGDTPGTLHLVPVLTNGQPAGSDSVLSARSAWSSHATGLTEAVELGRAVGAVPDNLVVLGLEPDDVGLGDGLSDVVRDALPTLLAAVRDVVRGPGERPGAGRRRDVGTGAASIDG